jgi:hypothetical protein
VLVKPAVALIGLLTVGGLGAWLLLGPQLADAYYRVWWRAVRAELRGERGALWTLRRNSGKSR